MRLDIYWLRNVIKMNKLKCGTSLSLFSYTEVSADIKKKIGQSFTNLVFWSFLHTVWASYSCSIYLDFLLAQLFLREGLLKTPQCVLIVYLHACLRVCNKVNFKFPVSLWSHFIQQNNQYSLAVHVGKLQQLQGVCNHLWLGHAGGVSVTHLD